MKPRRGNEDVALPDGREYELKFEIASGDVHRLLSNPSVTPPATETRLRSTYFDTADAILRRHGVSLRVRRSDASVIQTVKRTCTSIVDREEWEREGADAVPDLDWLRTTPLKPLFSKKRVADHLQARFTVDVERSVFALAQGDAAIEGALDRGTIETPAGSLPISEFELELKTGRPKAVLALARGLARDVPMTLSLASKSERGYGRGEANWGHATKALPLRLRKGMTLPEGFEAVTQACLRLLLANVALIGGGEDAEAVHKARIALRRLRAALDLFEPVLRRRWRRTILLDVKWMSGKLGAARDTDVFLEQLAGEVASDVANDVASDVAGNGEGEGGRELVGVMRDAQRAVRQALRRALASPRWRLLLLDLVDASQHGVRRGLRGRPLRPFLGARLATRRRSLAKRSRNLAALSPEARHDVRKRAKMLRYTCDFAMSGADLVPHRKSFRRLVDDLQILQETLGTLHDREALHDRLREDVIAREGSPGISEAVRAEAARIVSREAPAPHALREARRASRRIRRSRSDA